MRCAALALPLLAACAAAPRAAPCASFKVYWALTGPGAADPASPPLDNSTAGLPYLFEPAAQALVKRNPGPWPSCATQPNGSVASSNGGIPQNASAAAYGAALAADMAGWGLPPGWAGAGVFDMSWRPEFSFAGNDPCVAALSIARVRAAHPDWTNATQIAAAAAAEFEAAGAAFYEAALQQGTAGPFPAARWGFLGLPLALAAPCVNAGLVPLCGYHHPTAGPAQTTFNGNSYVARVANASTGVYPAVTLTLGAGAGAWLSRNTDALYGAVEQARTLAPGAWVLPVVTAAYADAPAAELAADDLAMVLRAAVQAGANGLVIRGDPFADAPAKAAGFAAYLASTLGPAVRAAVTDNCACAAASCSGAGNCVGMQAGPACTPPVACDPAPRAPACACSPAYGGATCNETAAFTQAAAAARLEPLARGPRPRPGAPAGRSSLGATPLSPPVAPGCPAVPQDAHFPQFWNIVDEASANKTGPVLDNSTLADAYLFTAGNQTRSGAVGGSLMPSCRTAFNRTANASYIQSFNGGIPQLANLTELFNGVRDEIAGNYTGNCKPTPKKPVCPGIGWGLQPDFEGSAAFDVRRPRGGARGPATPPPGLTPPPPPTHTHTHTRGRSLRRGAPSLWASGTTRA